MASSGIYVDHYVDTRWCEVESAEGVVCTFYGDIEIFFDPEIYSAWWTCPLCGYGHDEGWEDEYE